MFLDSPIGPLKIASGIVILMSRRPYSGQLVGLSDPIVLGIS
jgi:hypothetical protein